MSRYNFLKNLCQSPIKFLGVKIFWSIKVEIDRLPVPHLQGKGGAAGQVKTIVLAQKLKLRQQLEPFLIQHVEK